VQGGREVDDLADAFGDGVRGERGVEPSTGMADEDVTGLQGRDDRIATVRERGLFIDPSAVSR
jgi:hypothetical protein